MKNLTAAQIGRAGELLVQQQLLLHGIDSAQLTTDSGVDLVAFSAEQRDAMTLQVKANLRPKPAGGTGKLLLDWWLPDESPADLFAFVDLASSRVWLAANKEMGEIAQQHPESRYHFFMFTDPTATTRADGKPVHDYDFQKHLLENCVHKLI